MVLGNSETIPITKGQLAIGTWQVRELSEGICAGGGGPGRFVSVVWEGEGSQQQMCLCSAELSAVVLPLLCWTAAALQQQSVMLVELDGPRKRTVGIQVVGQTGGPAASSSSS